MNLNVLQLKDSQSIDLYSSLLEATGTRNPYFLKSFFTSFSSGIENLICFYTITDNEGVILLPVYIRDIESKPGFSDIISPYGYSGPIYSTIITESELQQFWNLIDVWYKKNNIVSEFIRFSLNENQIAYTGTLVPTMSNIKGKILNEEEQLRKFDRKVRKNINRANSENLTAKITLGSFITNSQLEEFYEIYIHTMTRNFASATFFYSKEIFSNFIKSSPDYCVLCSVYDNNICISTELCLRSSDSIFSFLGGTLDIGFSKRPNDFLKYALINWARNNNIHYYILGGGYGNDDGIFKFKQSFFPEDVVKYYTGRKIIAKGLYQELVDSTNNIRKSQGLEILDIEDQSFFPLYRKYS
jgi:hypothetical protein